MTSCRSAGAGSLPNMTVKAGAPEMGDAAVMRVSASAFGPLQSRRWNRPTRMSGRRSCSASVARSPSKFGSRANHPARSDPEAGQEEKCGNQ